MGDNVVLKTSLDFTKLRHMITKFAMSVDLSIVQFSRA